MSLDFQRSMCSLCSKSSYVISRRYQANILEKYHNAWNAFEYSDTKSIIRSCEQEIIKLDKIELQHSLQQLCNRANKFFLRSFSSVKEFTEIYRPCVLFHLINVFCTTGQEEKMRVVQVKLNEVLHTITEKERCDIIRRYISQRLKAKSSLTEIDILTGQIYSQHEFQFKLFYWDIFYSKNGNEGCKEFLKKNADFLISKIEGRATTLGFKWHKQLHLIACNLLLCLLNWNICKTQNPLILQKDEETPAPSSDAFVADTSTNYSFTAYKVSNILYKLFSTLSEDNIITSFNNYLKQRYAMNSEITEDDFCTGKIEPYYEFLLKLCYCEKLLNENDDDKRCKAFLTRNADLFVSHIKEVVLGENTNTKLASCKVLLCLLNWNICNLKSTFTQSKIQNSKLQESYTFQSEAENTTKKLCKVYSVRCVLQNLLSTLTDADISQVFWDFIEKMHTMKSEITPDGLSIGETESHHEFKLKLFYWWTICRKNNYEAYVKFIQLYPEVLVSHIQSRIVLCQGTKTKHFYCRILLLILNSNMCTLKNVPLLIQKAEKQASSSLDIVANSLQNNYCTAETIRSILQNLLSTSSEEEIIITFKKYLGQLYTMNSEITDDELCTGKIDPYYEFLLKLCHYEKLCNKNTETSREFLEKNADMFVSQIEILVGGNKKEWKTISCTMLLCILKFNMHTLKTTPPMFQNTEIQTCSLDASVADTSANYSYTANTIWSLLKTLLSTLSEDDMFTTFNNYLGQLYAINPEISEDDFCTGRIEPYHEFMLKLCYCEKLCIKKDEINLKKFFQRNADFLVSQIEEGVNGGKTQLISCKVLLCLSKWGISNQITAYISHEYISIQTHTLNADYQDFISKNALFFLSMVDTVMTQNNIPLLINLCNVFLCISYNELHFHDITAAVNKLIRFYAKQVGINKKILKWIIKLGYRVLRHLNDNQKLDTAIKKETEFQNLFNLLDDLSTSDFHTKKEYEDFASHFHTKKEDEDFASHFQTKKEDEDFASHFHTEKEYEDLASNFHTKKEDEDFASHFHNKEDEDFASHFHTQEDENFASHFHTQEDENFASHFHTKKEAVDFASHFHTEKEDEDFASHFHTKKEDEDIASHFHTKKEDEDFASHFHTKKEDEDFASHFHTKKEDEDFASHNHTMEVYEVFASLDHIIKKIQDLVSYFHTKEQDEDFASHYHTMELFETRLRELWIAKIKCKVKATQISNKIRNKGIKNLIPMEFLQTNTTMSEQDFIYEWKADLKKNQKNIKKMEAQLKEMKMVDKRMDEMVKKLKLYEMLLLFMMTLIVMVGVSNGHHKSAKLKKYLSLKYEYATASLYLLWCSGDIEVHPGPSLNKKSLVHDSTIERRWIQNISPKIINRLPEHEQSKYKPTKKVRNDMENREQFKTLLKTCFVQKVHVPKMYLAEINAWETMEYTILHKLFIYRCEIETIITSLEDFLTCGGRNKDLTDINISFHTDLKIDVIAIVLGKDQRPTDKSQLMVYITRYIAGVSIKCAHKKDPDAKCDGLWDLPLKKWPKDIILFDPNNRGKYSKKHPGTKLIPDQELVDMLLRLPQVTIPPKYKDIVEAFRTMRKSQKDKSINKQHKAELCSTFKRITSLEKLEYAIKNLWESGIFTEKVHNNLNKWWTTRAEETTDDKNFSQVDINDAGGKERPHIAINISTKSITLTVEQTDANSSQVSYNFPFKDECVPLQTSQAILESDIKHQHKISTEETALCSTIDFDQPTSSTNQFNQLNQNIATQSTTNSDDNSSATKNSQSLDFHTQVSPTSDLGSSDSISSVNSKSGNDDGDQTDISNGRQVLLTDSDYSSDSSNNCVSKTNMKKRKFKEEDSNEKKKRKIPSQEDKKPIETNHRQMDCLMDNTASFNKNREILPDWLLDIDFDSYDIDNQTFKVDQNALDNEDTELVNFLQDFIDCESEINVTNEII